MIEGPPRAGCEYNNEKERWDCPPLEIPSFGGGTWDDPEPTHGDPFTSGGGGGEAPPIESDKRVDPKCWTFQEVIDYLKKDLDHAWNKTAKSKKENGGFVVITDSLQLLTYVRAEGGEKSMGDTLPLIRELNKKYRNGVIASYHTHPDRDEPVPSGEPGKAGSGDYGVANKASSPFFGIIRVKNKISLYNKDGIIKKSEYKKNAICMDPLAA